MKSQILLLILSASLVACGTSKKTSASNRDLNKQPEQVTEDTEKKEDQVTEPGMIPVTPEPTEAGPIVPAPVIPEEELPKVGDTLEGLPLDVKELALAVINEGSVRAAEGFDETWNVKHVEVTEKAANELDITGVITIHKKVGGIIPAPGENLRFHMIVKDGKIADAQYKIYNSLGFVKDIAGPVLAIVQAYFGVALPTDLILDIIDNLLADKEAGWEEKGLKLATIISLEIFNVKVNVKS